MSESPDKKPAAQKRRRGIYLLPNLFTTAGLFAGFFAIIALRCDKLTHTAQTRSAIYRGSRHRAASSIILVSCRRP